MTTRPLPPRRRPRLVVGGGALALTALTALATLTALTVVQSPSTAAAPAAPAPSASSGRTAVTARPTVRKLLVVVMENHSLAQMRAQMPRTAAYADRYGYATDYRATTHPSLPNYLMIATGSTHGVTDDRPPSAHRLHGSTVFGQAVRAGRTARVYAEGMPSPCSTVDGGRRYAVRHNPWAYAVDERTLCRRDDVPFSRFAPDVAAGRLPTVGLVVPDTCHDAHDCPLATADIWFAGLMATVTAGPDWRAGRLAVVLTADEDDRRAGNRVLTVVIHPSVHHRVVTRRLGHPSITRLGQRVAGVPLTGAARTAPSLATAFGLRLP
ncbi:acid phosphatase [Friedmanniella endophytica]|uniref:Acid phosphatase n=1 Tax=Microlunatus kandeliicorticis TaxID=1759536 RepID=A0A7W3IUF4_9ACTN|nr:alkaline phosphatase family protein [Microlunatus kandeliicorticis]MBA8795399.1 acid phosphatase [Microlunatus kandeliicorticis]